MFFVVGGWKEKGANNKMHQANNKVCQSLVSALCRSSGSLLPGSFFAFIDHSRWMGFLHMKPCGHAGFHANYLLIYLRSTACCVPVSTLVHNARPRFQVVQNYVTFVDEAWVGKSGGTKS